ncbi:MAG: Dolichyl-phosphate-mannose-protein mannosyltransferase family protein, partial [Parcubacteria group bacterium Athens1014_10]
KIVDQGKIDFSIPGFHGPSFFAALIYFFTHSHFSIIIFEMITAVLTIPMIYLAVKEIFKDKFLGVLSAYIYISMPLIHFTAFRGWNWTSITFFSFLTLYLLSKKSSLSWLIWGISMIIKPFSIALLPFFIYYKKWKQLFLALVIPLVYALIQYSQIGQLFIGAHPSLTSEKLFDLSRFFPNLIFAFQSYFSVHNYSPFNEVPVMDMIHFSPFITFFALLAVVYYKKYFIDKKLFLILISAALVAFVIPASFYYFDRYYFTVFDLILILIAIKPMAAYKELLPVVAFSFSYQFLYVYLSYKPVFWPSGHYFIFIIPLIVLLISIIYIYQDHRRRRCLIS